MSIQKIVTALLFTLAASASVADSTPAAALPIQRELHYTQLPKPEIAGKRLHVAFANSPKMTQLLQARLRARGFILTDNPEDAEAQFRLNGMFMLSGAGKAEVRGKLSELLESSLVMEPATSPDYRHQNVDLLQIGVSVARTGIASSLSITDMVRWLSQKSGIAGRFNEWLTGDPRGFCLAESCSQYTSTVILAVTGDSGHWWLQEKIQDPKVLLDKVFADALDHTLKPLEDLLSRAVPPAGETPQ